MTEPQPEALAAFLASAEYSILQAPQGSDEDASEALIAAGCRYAPRLLAAVEAALDLADGWTRKSEGLDAAAEYAAAEAPTEPGAGLKHARSIAYDECARGLRDEISRALVREEQTDG